MVMKRFEIIEKLYLFKALLKMAGEGVHPPHPPLALGMLLKRLFASFATAIFRKICRGPHGQNHKYGMGASHRAS